MLIELTPEEMDEVIPLTPTGTQYGAYISNVFLDLQRAILGIGGGFALLFLSRFFSETGLGFIFFIAGGLGLLWPFVWGPLFEISRRNNRFRELPYGFFFFGQIKRVDSREVLVDEIEKMDENGEIYVEEVIEQELRLSIGDETGLSFVVRTRDEPAYEAIVPRQSAIALVKSYSRNLRDPIVSEVYVVRLGQWVGDLSYLKREEFLDLANELVELA